MRRAPERRSAGVGALSRRGPREGRGWDARGREVGVAGRQTPSPGFGIVPWKAAIWPSGIALSPASVNLPRFLPGNLEVGHSHDYPFSSKYWTQVVGHRAHTLNCHLPSYFFDFGF